MQAKDATNSQRTSVKLPDGKWRWQNAMTTLQKPDEASPGAKVALGLVTAGGGLYFMLVGLGVLPPPSGPNAPGWVVIACGLIFLLGGLAVVGQAAAKAGPSGDLPADAPLWAKLLQHAAVLVIVGCFAAIGTWISMFGQADKFSGWVGLSRFAFGLGALVMWLFFVALVRRMVRLVFGGQA